MASIADVAIALSRTLETIDGLRVVDYVPDSINPPAAFLVLGEIVEDTFGYETMQVPFDVVVLLSRTSARVGQRSLYDLASPIDADSVWRAIGDDPTLGLDDTSARVARYRPLGIEEIAALGYLGGIFEVVVVTPGA